MRFAEVEVTQMTLVPLNFNRGQGQVGHEVELAHHPTRGASGGRDRKESAYLKVARNIFILF